jgi:hypothetical protein
MCRGNNYVAYAEQDGCRNMVTGATGRTSEQVMVDMIREDLGVVIDPQAWRMFIRQRFERIKPLAHRIHDGKR